MSVRVAIAEAVKDALNQGVAAGTFGAGVSFTAVRVRVPVRDVEELSALTVSVACRSYGEEPANRSDTTATVQVDIGVQKKVTDDAECDGLDELVEAICGFFRRRALATTPTAYWTETSNPLPYSSEHLSEKRVYTSVLTLSYRTAV